MTDLRNRLSTKHFLLLLLTYVLTWAYPILNWFNFTLIIFFKSKLTIFYILIRFSRVLSVVNESINGVVFFIEDVSFFPYLNRVIKELFLRS